MKVKNPSTGNFEEVYVKALDGLPVGTEVDFDGTSTDIPVGWEQVSGKSQIVYELYNDTTGGTSILLSDSVANYDYIEITYKETTSNKSFISQKIPTSETSTVLSYYELPSSASGNIRYFGASFNISGTSISLGSNYGFATVNGSDSVHYENRIKIMRVIGYKEV